MCRKLYILRGIPGTGKTTWCYKKYEAILSKSPYTVVAIISRDAFRMHEVKYSEAEYQKSFNVPDWNASIKKRFWKYAYDNMEDCDVMILDTTMCSYQDIWDVKTMIFDYMGKHDLPEIRWKIFTKEHGSTHGVPEKVMDGYRTMFDLTAGDVAEPWFFSFNENESYCYKTKWEYIKV
jgi:hypothetical protein